MITQHYATKGLNKCNIKRLLEIPDIVILLFYKYYYIFAKNRKKYCKK